MKRQFSIRALWGSGLWVLLVSLPVSLAAQDARGPQNDARAILDKAITSLGGDAFIEASDTKLTGRFFQFQRGQMVGGEVFTDFIQFPDKERTEFGKKAEVIRINNGVQGWNVRDKEVEEQIPEQIDTFWEGFKVGLDYVLRFAVNEPETTLQYLGRDMIDFKRVDILELRDDDRTRITLYIDRSTGLPVKKSVRRLNNPALEEELYSNYHEIQGVVTPLLIHRYTDGQKTMEIRFESVSYNNAFADTLFLAPARR